jgi:hypothetical protein
MFNKITSKYFKGKNHLEDVEKKPKESATSIPKKGDHEPTKYFEDEKLSNTEKLTESKIDKPEEFSEYDIENLCSKYLMNIIYYKMAKKRKREEALEIAANVILKKGEEIKNQLNQNDLEGKKGQNKDVKSDTKVDLGAKNSVEVPQTQDATTQDAPNPKGEKSDIPKISGGTLSEVIAKITEMLAGKSGAELKNGADNLSAMFEVLSSPQVENKFADVMGYLAQDPILVADIKDFLKDTKSATIFDQAIQNNLSANQQQAVSQVSQSDIDFRRQENIAGTISNQQEHQQR